MSPIDHLIVTVIGSRRAQAREPRPTPAPDGRQQPQPPAEPRPVKSGNA